jgi:nicotinamidase-related amidase
MSDAEITRPAAGGTALLIIDMINDLQFEGAEKMREPARAAATVIAGLREEADRRGVPVVYVNDNYGQWHSERSRIIEHAQCGENGAEELVERIRPRDDDYFVIKPQFSGFYSTNLPALLPRLGASRLILTGVAADICVLFTAGDAHMREYDLWVPSDAVASSDAQRTRWALEIMQHSMKAEISTTRDLPLIDWINRSRP